MPCAMLPAAPRRPRRALLPNVATAAKLSSATAVPRSPSFPVRGMPVKLKGRAGSGLEAIAGSRKKRVFVMYLCVSALSFWEDEADAAGAGHPCQNGFHRPSADRIFRIYQVQ
jgi:hypothetical protein